MNGLWLVELNGLLERNLDLLLRSVCVLQVEKSDPDVQLFLFLPEADRLESSLGDLPSLLNLRHGQLERHVLDPKERRVGSAEEESFKVGGRFGSLGVKVAGQVLLDDVLLLFLGSGDLGGRSHRGGLIFRTRFRSRVVIRIVRVPVETARKVESVRRGDGLFGSLFYLLVCRKVDDLFSVSPDEQLLS